MPSIYPGVTYGSPGTHANSLQNPIIIVIICVKKEAKGPKLTISLIGRICAQRTYAHGTWSSQLCDYSHRAHNIKSFFFGWERSGQSPNLLVKLSIIETAQVHKWGQD